MFPQAILRLEHETYFFVSWDWTGSIQALWCWEVSVYCITCESTSFHLVSICTRFRTPFGVSRVVSGAPPACLPWGSHDYFRSECCTMRLQWSQVNLSLQPRRWTGVFKVFGKTRDLLWPDRESNPNFLLRREPVSLSRVQWPTKTTVSKHLIAKSNDAYQYVSFVSSAMKFVWEWNQIVARVAFVRNFVAVQVGLIFEESIVDCDGRFAGYFATTGLVVRSSTSRAWIVSKLPQTIRGADGRNGARQIITCKNLFELFLRLGFKRPASFKKPCAITNMTQMKNMPRSGCSMLDKKAC